MSNVIGSLNPRYGLFGDTVNTASRMESNSFGSRILCSASSFQLLKEQAPDMPCKKRGKIPVKGKGDMTVYWIGDELIAKNKKERRKTISDQYGGSFSHDISTKELEESGTGFEGLVANTSTCSGMEADADKLKEEHPEGSKTSGSSQTDEESSDEGFQDEPQPSEVEEASWVASGTRAPETVQCP